MNPWSLIVLGFRSQLVTSLGVLVLLTLALAAGTATSLLARGLTDAGATSAQDYDLVVGAPGSALDLVLATVFLKSDVSLPLLDLAVRDRLAADPRVAATSGFVMADHYLDSPIVGIEASFPTLRPGLTLAEGRWPTAPFEVVAGAGVSVVLGTAFHGVHGTEAHEGFEAEEHEHEHTEATYHVVGRLRSSGTPWDRAILTPVEGLWLLHESPIQQRTVAAVLVKPRDVASAYALRAEYGQRALAVFPAETLASLLAVFEQGQTMVRAVTSAVQGLVLLVVVLSLLMSLSRQRDGLGVLRALGAGPFYLFLTLWAPSALLFAASAVAGGALGAWGSVGLASAIRDLTSLVLPIRWSWDETLALLGILALGVVAALIPAFAVFRRSVRASLLSR